MINKIKPFLIIAAIVFIYFQALDKPLAKFENHFFDLQFELRGSTKIDTNIVILYIDKDALDSLGRIPLKWNYYTRLIDGLTQFGAKAIGIENVFDKNSPDYLSQAAWLVSSIQKSKRVCIGGYFENINLKSDFEEQYQNKNYINNSIGKIESDSSQFLAGHGLDVPFTWLLKNAAGFGHLNLDTDPIIRKVPLILDNLDSSSITENETNITLAFGLELVRIYLGLSKDSIIIGENEIKILNGNENLNIPIINSQMYINFGGGINYLNMISISNFLKLYQAKNNIDVLNVAEQMFKNKIVLIGMLGQLTNNETIPLEIKFPTMGIHANIIDTILNSKYFYFFPLWLTELSTLFIAFIIFFLIVKLKINFQKTILLSISFLLFYLLVAFLLFKTNIVFPIQPVIIGLIFIVLSSIYKNNLLFSDAKKIEKEKISIETMLNKSSKKIAHLENSINKMKNEQQETDVDIYEFQTNIIDLKNRFDDLKPFEKFNLKFKRSLGDELVYSKNSKMRNIADLVKKISNTDANILIIGESGTGKELIAKAIHNLSNRKNEKFIALNCGALTETLLESELFGFTAGSFTDAKKQHKGYFEEANNGTIFLDEITETSELFQIKLLRVLQSGEINRIGDTNPIKIDVRVVASTNKKIENLVLTKEFREDLYYRLNVLKISVPPLRLRKPDILILVKYFLEKENAYDVILSKTVMKIFYMYNWPGNIRELENIIKRAVILINVENTKMIQLSHLPKELLTNLNIKFKLENIVLEKIREKKFSFKAISEIANEIGGIHRGTVAEYVKGIFFKEFCNHYFDIYKTVQIIADSDNEEVKNRVRIKLSEYLNNLFSKIDKKIPDYEIRENLQNTFKKLPKRYHIYVEKIIDYYNNSKGDVLKILLTNEVK